MPSRHFTLSVLAAALTWAGCAAEPSPAAVQPLPDVATSCADHAACAANQVCTQKACKPVFPGTYQLTVVKASLNSFDETGTPWDVDGPPDPFVVVRIGDKPACQTAVRANVDVATWDKPCAVALTAADNLTFEVRDDDAGKIQAVSQKTLPSEDLVAILRGGEGLWQDTFVKLEFTLTP